MAEEMVDLRWELDTDGSAALLTVARKGGEELGQIRLDARALSEVISGLAGLREQMSEEDDAGAVEYETEIRAVFDPEWHIEAEPMMEGTALALRHPGYGLLGFVFPREEVEVMTQTLLRHIQIARGDPSKRN